MNRLRRFVFATAILGVWGGGTAFASTCTVVPGGLALIAHIPSAGVKFVFPFPDVGLVIPIDVDAQGTISMHRAGLPVVSVATAGPSVEVHMEGPDASGHIDAGGNISIPGFALDTVLFGQTIPTNLTLETGPQAKLLNNVEYPVGGTQLDFTTGIVTLQGADVIPFAPIVEEPVVSGISITCRIAPVPDPATLPPAGLRLTGVAGVAKTGTADKGDTLALHAKLLSTGGALDVAGDIYLRVQGSSGELATVLVRGGNFSIKGHRLPARTVSGDGVKLLAGTKIVDNQPLATSGSVRVGGKDTGVKVNVKLTGLDLSRLTEQLRVTAEVGGAAGSAAVSVHGTGKTRRLK